MDYEKAFDCVYHDRIMQCLDHVDMDCNDKRVIEKLYWQQTATVRFGDEYSEFFPIKMSVRQGCVISPKLFNLYTEKTLIKVMNYLAVLFVERILTT